MSPYRTPAYRVVDEPRVERSWLARKITRLKRRWIVSENIAAFEQWRATERFFKVLRRNLAIEKCNVCSALPRHPHAGWCLVRRE